MDPAPTVSPASVILQQLNATLLLVETLSSSLTISDIMAVRTSLLQTQISMDRLLASGHTRTEGVALASEFLEPTSTPLPRSLVEYRRF